MSQKIQNPTLLGTEKISKLLATYSIPAIIAMLASSLYNIVDSIFIGQGVGAMAISGLAITFPLMNLSAAFGAMVGAGGSTLMSIKMGQKDDSGATRVLGNIAVLNLIIGVLIMIFAFLFLDPILYFFGASDQTVGYARDYMEIILGGNLITHLYLGLNSAMRASGYPKKAMITTFITVIANAILDPIFIFGFNMGIRGAAIATILAQVIALIWVTVHFSQKQHYIHFKRSAFRLSGRIVGGIISIGMSPFIVNICACFVVILLNKALLRHGGDYAVGAYGIVYKLVMLTIMILMGLTQGMQPIAGFNFGANHHQRVKEVLMLTIKVGTVITVVSFLLFQLFPHTLVGMFTRDEKMIAMSVYGLRLDTIILPVVGAQIVISNFFQSIGKAWKSIILSSTRQLIFLVPSILILPQYLGLTGVWISSAVGDALASITSAIMLWFQLKQFKKSEMQ